MSMPTVLTADPDNFRKWQAEIDLDQVEPMAGPKVPDRHNRAAQNRDATAEIVEGYLAWQHGRAV